MSRHPSKAFQASMICEITWEIEEMQDTHRMTGKIDKRIKMYCKITIPYQGKLMEKLTWPDTRLPKSRAGGQGLMVEGYPMII